MSTYFKVEINDVKNPNGDKTIVDLTNCSTKDHMLEELASQLDCEEDELDFQDAWMDAEEDFLLDLLDIRDIHKIDDDTFDNIDTIENSNQSLDVWEAANALIGTSGGFDIVASEVKNYIGEFDSEADFAEAYYTSDLGGEPLEIPSVLQGCIDWDRVWSSDLRHGITESNGYYFND